MSKHKRLHKLLPSPALGHYLGWRIGRVLKKRGVFYSAAIPILGILILNSQAVDLDLVKDKVNSFVLAQAENPQDQFSQGGGFLALSITQENSLLATNQILSQEEVITRRINVVVTAYSSEEWQTDDSPFITALGTYVRDGIVASNLLPFGAKIRIPELFGQKIFVVEDRLHSRKGLYQIDVWFPSTQQATAFGAKYTYIEVVE